MPETTKNLTHIWIELTNRCNLKCDFCFHSNNSMTRPKGMMSYKLFKKIIDEISQNHSKLVVSLHLAGESFLHKNLFEFIRYAREQDADVGLTTNGTLLDKDDYGILRTGVRRINISLAGVDEEDYEMVRVNSQFSKIKEKIKYLASQKLKLNLDTILTVNVIQTESNKDKINKFKNEFESIEGLDFVLIRGVMFWPHKDANEDINRVKEPGSNGYCKSVNMSTGILWDGTIVPCCKDFNGSIPLGNINDAKFIDIWNGNKMNNLRNILKSFELTKKHPVCGPCNLHLVKY